MKLLKSIILLLGCFLLTIDTKNYNVFAIRDSSVQYPFYGPHDDRFKIIHFTNRTVTSPCNTSHLFNFFLHPINGKKHCMVLKKLTLLHV